MGRPLIYICAVTIVVLGIIQINLNDRHLALAKRTVHYANGSEMVNLAHAGIEKTFNRLREDATWRNNNQPYQVALDYGTASVMIYDSSTDTTLGSDQLRLTSDITMDGESRSVMYKVNIVWPQLPLFPGALALTDPQFQTALGGSFYIDGRDESGVDPVGLPGITVIDQESKDKIIAEDPTYQFLDQVDGSTGTGSEPSIAVDPTMDYSSISDLIELLAPTATKLSGGPYTQDFGSQNNPGVFLIEDYVKIAANTKGYGIMIIKNNADLDVETTLNAAGDFNFHGLVLFEDSWAMDGKGNVTIHGSVIVGSKSEFSEINIDLTGNLSILYNSLALNYAREAARRNIPASFTILDIYE